MHLLLYCYSKHFPEKCSVLFRNLFIIHLVNTVMKRAWIPLTLESVINVTPLPAIKFDWEDEHQNILANLLFPSPRLLVFVQKLSK